MIGEPPGRSGSAVHLFPPDMVLDVPTAGMSPMFTRGGGSVGSPRDGDVSPFLMPLRRYLPSNEFGGAESESPPASGGEWPNVPADVYSSDEFRMFEFKIQRCSRGKSHDWTECPFAHPGEKARRRDPRKYFYSGAACPEFRKGGCVKGDLCEFSHGVFECWLHPSRYRTQACKDGTCCGRRVCFFAHTPEQLRAVPPQSPRSGLDPYDCSSIRHAFEPFLASPTSTLAPPASESPPLSPGSYPTGRGSVGELVASIRKLQIGKESGGKLWGVSGYGSPRRSVLRHASASPTVSPFPYPCGHAEVWDAACTEDVAAAGMVESGRKLRAAILEKLGKEKSGDVGDAAACPGPDVGWVSELVNTG